MYTKMRDTYRNEIISRYLIWHMICLWDMQHLALSCHIKKHKEWWCSTCFHLLDQFNPWCIHAGYMVYHLWIFTFHSLHHSLLLPILCFVKPTCIPHLSL